MFGKQIYKGGLDRAMLSTIGAGLSVARPFDKEELSKLFQPVDDTTHCETLESMKQSKDDMTQCWKMCGFDEHQQHPAIIGISSRHSMYGPDEPLDTDTHNDNNNTNNHRHSDDGGTADNDGTKTCCPSTKAKRSASHEETETYCALENGNKRQKQLSCAGGSRSMTSVLVANASLADDNNLVLVPDKDGWNNESEIYQAFVDASHQLARKLVRDAQQDTHRLQASSQPPPPPPPVLSHRELTHRIIEAASTVLGPTIAHIMALPDNADKSVEDLVEQVLGCPTSNT